MKKRIIRTLDLLAFAPHPDDAELGCGGLLALLAGQHYRVGLIDLTLGELGSAGTPAKRETEAAQASKILGISLRKNLGLPDGAINPYNKDQLGKTVEALRLLRPKMVCLPLADGRHPDHEAASILIRRAVFLAGLQKYSVASLRPYKVPTVIEYPTRREILPSFVVDISKVFRTKIKAIKAFKSQIRTARIKPGKALKQPLIQSSLTIPFVEARARYFGAMIGVPFGEGFVSRTTLAISDPLEFFEMNPSSGAVAFPYSKEIIDG